jgi:hypothetical protein
MRELNIGNENIVDISTVIIDQSLPPAERYADYKRQRKGNMKECYCLGFKVNEYYPETGKTLTDCIIQLFPGARKVSADTAEL